MTATARPSELDELLDRPLLYVTGKGGAGKTTVAAALGLSAAARGRRTLVCELAGAALLPRAFGASPGRGGELCLSEDLWWLSVDPQTALAEWLRRQPGGALAAGVLMRSATFEHFVAAAPGAKELLTIGKLADLAGRDSAEPPYELVVADGPATGHALGMLGAPGSIGRAAPLSPVGAQARGLQAYLADRASTGYVAATLAEDMSVHEVLELEERLPGVVGRELDPIVVDGMYPDRFDDDEAAKLQALSERHPKAGVLRAALMHHRRARRQAEQVRRLRRSTRTPIVTLPFLFVPRLGPAEYEELAAALAAARPTSSRRPTRSARSGRRRHRKPPAPPTAASPPARVGARRRSASPRPRRR